jgi:heme A synthase
MVIAWMLILPLGIFLARFGRTFFTWFPAHRAVQTSAFLVIVIALILAITGIKSRSGDHYSSAHAKAGLITVILLLLQCVLGALAHWYRGKTGQRYIGYAHMPLGIILVGECSFSSPR